MTVRSVVLGSGSYLPPKIVTNDELSKLVETSDKWIAERTGIRSRHIADTGVTTSDLALEASRRALANSSVEASELDMVIVATTTPDETFPSVATNVQARLGMETGAAFDIQAVCSGFVYGLSVADSLIRCGQARTVLLVGAETMSRILDWKDRATSHRPSCTAFHPRNALSRITAPPVISRYYDGRLTNYPRRPRGTIA